MISGVELEKFRGIRSVGAPLEISKFTVLMGPNGAGKSSILEALCLLPPGGMFLDMNKGTFLGIRGHDSKRSLVYLGSDEARVITRTEGGEVEIAIYGAEHELSFGKGYMLSASGLFAHVKPDDSELAKVLGIGPNEVSSYSLIFSGDTDWQMRLASSLASTSTWWTRVEASGAHWRVVKELVDQGLIPERFTEVVPVGDELRLRKETSSGPYYLRLNEVSTGLKSFLVAALAIEVANPKLILWDDFESNTHPSLLGHILGWLSSRPAQVVIATHSIDVLYELAMGKVQEFTVLRLKKSAEDVVSAEVLREDDLAESFEANIDPRKIVG
ncbi:MAG: AAA family ATPase [Conexivisphaera sp.]